MSNAAGDLLFPRSVHLTLPKLIKAAQGSTMSTLISKAGMDWVLNGTAPPEGSPWADRVRARVRGKDRVLIRHAGPRGCDLDNPLPD